MPPLKYRPKISYDGPGTTTPAVPAGAAATTGGALATGTIFYRSAALFAIGESAKSPEGSTAITGPTGKLTLTQGAVAGALGYRFYLGTAADAYSGYIDVIGSNVLNYTGQATTPGYPSTNLVNVPLSIPQKLWRPRSKALVGGFDTVPSGAGESYVVQWGELARVTLRFLEWGAVINEQEALRVWWKWAVTTSGLSNFFFDQTVNTAYAVYVDGPTMLEGFDPDPMSNYQKGREEEFLMRIGDNVTPINPPFYVGG